MSPNLKSKTPKSSNTSHRKCKNSCKSLFNQQKDYYDNLALKYQNSRLKQTVIIDDKGNNNLNLSPKRIKSDEDLFMQIYDLKINNNNNNNDHFGRKNCHFKTELLTPVIYLPQQDIIDKESEIKTINNTIFTPKEKEEINNISFLNNDNFCNNESFSLDTSNLSLSSSNDNNKTLDQQDIAPIPLYSPRELLK